MNFSFFKKEWFLFCIILAAFLLVRAPHIQAPYHQDEYKWVMYSHPELTEPGTVPHPPLTEFIYTQVGPLLGDNNFRVIPLVFSFLNLILLFWLTKIMFGKKYALITALLFTISFHSVLASRMVDVDGAVMPFFFLVLSIGYVYFKKSNFSQWIWFGVIVFGAVGGFLVKMSGLLPILAISLDFAFEKNIFSNRKSVLKYAGFSLLGALVLFLTLVSARFVFPFFNLEYSFGYWEHFANFSNFFSRGWFQTFIQVMKSVLYLSPLLLAPMFFVDKDIFRQTRMFFIFIILGLFFYIIAFDFSIGALDRYMQFLIIPLCVVSAYVYGKFLENYTYNKKIFLLYAVLVGIIFSIQFIHHAVPPLYPKTEWVSRILSLRWTFLYPFSGGSGPLPFYVSFAFLGLSWVSACVLLLCVYVKKTVTQNILLGIFMLGTLYNGVFIQEYLFGRINGSSGDLVRSTTQFIKENKDIEKVTVYNDNGGWNVQETGKYRKRLYIDPKFDVAQKVRTLNQYKEHYVVVDIPHIDESTVYAKYFASCAIIFTETSGYINARVYDCRKAPDLKLY